MESSLPHPKLHLFVCTNHREVGECCSKRGSVNLHKNLKDAIRSDADLKNDVKISKSGCLGLCSMGIAAVHYPEGKWMIELKENDTEKVLAEIKEKLGKK